MGSFYGQASFYYSGVEPLSWLCWLCFDNHVWVHKFGKILGLIETSTVFTHYHLRSPRYKTPYDCGKQSKWLLRERRRERERANNDHTITYDTHICSCLDLKWSPNDKLLGMIYKGWQTQTK